MARQKDFDSFIKNIEPSDSTVSYISSVHNNLREYLKQHDLYSDIYSDSFLSGSYAKHTSIRPVKDDKKGDVDIIVVTKYNRSKNSKEVLDELKSVLLDSKKYETAKIQHHSVGIEMGQISVDVVPVIQDKSDDQLYMIGDAQTGKWSFTDPKGHKNWSTSVNQNNNNKYKPLVKIIKWWRHVNCPLNVKFPKGITLEKIIADNLGDSTASTEDFLIETMENIVSKYKDDYVDIGSIPEICDPSNKVHGNDLLSEYSLNDFKEFIYKIDEHLSLLNDSGNNNDSWRIILGGEFPKGETESANNYLICERASHRKPLLWPFSRGSAAFIRLTVKDKCGNTVEYINNGEPIDKGYSLCFHAFTGVKAPYTVKWQITNTGTEAAQAQCLRGYFENSDDGKNTKYETTSYTGSHSVQCFIIKNGICMAKSKPHIINIK